MVLQAVRTSGPRRMAIAEMQTKNRSTALIKALQQIVERSSHSSPWDSQEIIRAEIFGGERFEQHAESLAVAQTISPRPTRGHSLRRRLYDNDRTLLRAYETIAALIDQGRPITPAAEWLVDNYHIVEEQIREIRDDLPPGYYRQLPKLATGRSRAIRASSAWPGRSSPTPTAASIPQMLVPLRPGLSARPAADDRRAVGGRDHAAHRPGGKSAAARRADRAGGVRPPAGRRVGRPTAGRRRARPREPAAVVLQPFARRRCRPPSPCSWSSGCATRTRR